MLRAWIEGFWYYNAVYVGDTEEEKVRVDGEKMRGLRDDKLLTMEELAELADVSFNTVYRLEHNLSGGQQSTIKKVARVLGVAPRDLLLQQEKERVKV